MLSNLDVRTRQCLLMHQSPNFSHCPSSIQVSLAVPLGMLPWPMAKVTLRSAAVTPVVLLATQVCAQTSSSSLPLPALQVMPALQGWTAFFMMI